MKVKQANLWLEADAVIMKNAGEPIKMIEHRPTYGNLPSSNPFLYLHMM
jgi:hypothetical protein